MSAGRIRRVLRSGSVVASAVVLAGVLAPSAAVASHNPFEPIPCKPDARYAIGWQPDGEWLFGRDCKADGYGVVVEADYLASDGSWKDIVDVWDSSSAGDGAWRQDLNAPENKKVRIYVWKSKNSTVYFGDPIAVIDDRGYHT